MGKIEKKRMTPARAWLLYDMGSSAYALCVGTLFFPLFFTNYAAQGTAARFHWPLAVVISTALVGITAPLIGRFADARGLRNSIFITTGMIAVAGTAVLPVTATVPIVAAVGIFVVVHVSFSVAINFYDSYLSLYGSQDRNYTVRSGTGWALGYLGGLICLGLVLFALGFSVPKSIDDYWIVFVTTAVVYGGLSLYVFSRLPPESRKTVSHRFSSVRAVLKTLKQWRQRKVLFLVLLANILIADGMTTLLFFTSTYAQNELFFSMAEIVLLFAILQAVAVPSTWLVARASAKFREETLLLLCCLGWSTVAVGLVSGPGPRAMFWVASCAGLIVGSTPALLRAIIGRLIPPDERAELFGFAALASKAGGVLGPTVYLIALQLWGPTAGILTVLPVFAVGGGMIFWLGKDIRSTEILERSEEQLGLVQR